MAVEAQQLHLFSTQLLLKSTTTTSREYFIGNQYMYNAPMGAFVDSPAAAGTGYVVPSESGLTTDVVNPANGVPRKRPRGNLEQMVDFERLIVQHDEKVRAEVMEKRRFAKKIMEAVEERVSKRLRAKDEEIEQMSKLNWAMEEKLKRLVTENQVWRYLAQTNEAAANAIRTSLEQVLAEQLVRVEEKQDILASAAAAADDAESCCGDNFHDDRKDEADAAGTTTLGVDWRKLCRRCCADEPSVLLMPCHHLCLCPTCVRWTNACPICNCCKTGSVYVNLSQ
ncbi:putative BOI-related E3 ubiquitin-protein ligase 3 [Iris pallida]|uniref:BOI-related E3 ubiquitin-protein ligase 3 n=1 Tax=Iris pallida TaxID=29817 RepID=A0AAX6HC46_IRIPA|nr:putative BOI-related E3 ubiquitin-protein ligase 3 [Iris pallida]